MPAWGKPPWGACNKAGSDLTWLAQNKLEREIRLVSLLGYRFSDSKKLELGLDYRLDSFLTQGARQRLWIALNWYQVI